MNDRKSIYIIILFVVILALAIQITSIEFAVQLNTNENEDIIDYRKNPGTEIDKKVLENISTDSYLIIYDPKKEYLLRVKDNVEKLFYYTKKEYDAVNVEEISSINQKYKGVIMVIEDIDSLKNADSLMKYIFEGGHVFFPYRLEPTGNFYNISLKLGIEDSGDFVISKGIRILDNVIIMGNGFELTQEVPLENSSLAVALTDDCERYVESIEGNTLLWKKSYGMGNIVYFNGTALEDTMTKGFILGAISLLEEEFIYPIINSKISYIDDFPAPFPQGNNPKIQQEFGRNLPQFYKDIWWPDMLELAAKYKIKYTGVIIGTYSDEVENITAEGLELPKTDFFYYGRELINGGGEIGIHGYNHQPLATAEFIDQNLGYKPWKNNGAMEDSIEEVNAFGKKAFPNYAFRVYVPPSNILYPEGRKALLAADSDIKIIASLQAGEGNPDVYLQEFGISDDGIIELPRFTYGYVQSDDNEWFMINGITAYGYFSHFVHPDDVLDGVRTGEKGWSQIFKEYDDFNKKVFNHYGWLRPHTASEGADAMVKYLLCEPKYEMRENTTTIYSNHFYDKMYFILRTKKQVESVENCKIEEIDKNTYLIENNKPICKINYKR